MVEWIFSHFSQCVSEVGVVEEAASTGQVEILKFLLVKDSGHMQEECEAGVNKIGDDGDAHRIVLEGNGVTWGGKDMVLAAKNAHSDTVRWLHENTGSTERDAV
ncbi:hypothetical protein PHYPSEUDO_011611 [Phytophthora pseudosyringae]|uniref:Uncharacterized protein n=1 Tax=Phytophthora pseudosyringae TaxID=221518 RepID=A0A8T1VBI3_9STRA|nr:hypothetical protein PHYPSEUDO_011611 [Phytophthora pseudosyringae]